jgi:hypothetical protein
MITSIDAAPSDLPLPFTAFRALSQDDQALLDRWLRSHGSATALAGDFERMYAGGLARGRRYFALMQGEDIAALYTVFPDDGQRVSYWVSHRDATPKETGLSGLRALIKMLQNENPQAKIHAEAHDDIPLDPKMPFDLRAQWEAFVEAGFVVTHAPPRFSTAGKVLVLAA